MGVYTCVYTHDMPPKNRVRKQPKNELARESVPTQDPADKPGFEFGALRHLFGPDDTSESIARELKEMDEDHDLDAWFAVE